MLISTKNTGELSKRLGSSDSREIFCSGLRLSARWKIMSQAASTGIHIIILSNREEAEYCASDLYGMVEGDRIFFLPEAGRNIEKSNYRATLSVQRTSALNKILSHKGKDLLYIVTYPEALEETIPDIRPLRHCEEGTKCPTWQSHILTLHKGDEITHETIRNTLFAAGFEKVDFVSEPGQFALRGGIADIFSYSFNNPFRLTFFGDEIEKIHTFDCNTQLSIDPVDSVEIFPDLFSSHVILREATTGSDEESPSISISELFPATSTIWLDSAALYKEREFFSHLKGFKKVFIDIPTGENVENPIKFNISPQPAFNKNFDLLIADIRSKTEQGYKVIIFGEKEAQLDRLKSILSQERGINPEFCSGHNIHSGFIDSDDKVCCYSDHEIFDRFHRVTLRRTVDKSEQLTVNDLASFNIGDYIVHINHGVGIFGGLVKMTDDKGRVNEVVKLIYKDNDIVFVSVHALHRISRYRSKDAEPPKIHKLGSKVWQTLKSSAKAKVKDIAKELIQLYAKRKASEGFAFSPDSYLQTELESSFMYEDTPDQEKATAAVKHDMEGTCPMDRLICGDVGFGKTEIAIRAAFKAAVDGKQTAVLVPTTILALQHYNTFSQRLKDFPCNIDYVSRLRTAKEITDIRERLSTGKIDIIIGTHKLLGKDFQFKDLGLLIIDEEQKFGVSAKERLRQLKLSVDTLTLTATPIPRTLQFSLLGARDLSIINTPPPNRIPVQTEIILFDNELISSIIRYELGRGGQIFFLHNKVEELSSIEQILHRLVPDMKICVAHGQMEAKVLENKILDFMAGDYDLLLCTTIIENGLDIPNANTIIINQAQNIGLSDLHQLRGRVGRSNKRAFCYLIVPPLVSITDDARRRLKAIEAFSDLGSGFNIAMQDLDIRGAGNLLGAEQSGYISDMGFETYQKILAEAMEELGVETGIDAKAQSDDRFTVDCTIETDIAAMIPDTYIDITAEKIRIYKDLDSTADDRSLGQMRLKIEDRFGKMPEEVVNLFDIVRIRHLAESLGFEKVIIKNGILIGFFIYNQLSGYYRSKAFERVLEKINTCGSLFELKQGDDGRLKIISRSVNSLQKAHEILQKLS